MTHIETLSVKELLLLESKLKLELRFLLYLYNYYCNCFKGKTPEEAEMRYYCEKYEESGYDSEGLFSLNHTTLKMKIKENRTERNNIASDLKEIKLRIKEKNNVSS